MEDVVVSIRAETVSIRADIASLRTNIVLIGRDHKDIQRLIFESAGAHEFLVGDFARVELVALKVDSSAKRQRCFATAFSCRIGRRRLQICRSCREIRTFWQCSFISRRAGLIKVPNRINLDCRSRRSFASSGKYYVVDSGYPCTKGFLPPYRGQRYHLQDYRGNNRQLRGAKELFNYRHSSLRNVIERCFGVLKARFPILKLMPYYKLVRQRLIITTYCTIHNFIRQNILDDCFFMEYGEKDVSVTDGGNDNSSNAGVLNALNLSNDGATQMGAFRTHLTNQMWASFRGNG
ncbi:uncharacterized protein LOC132316293 [Cornus florida]|uniref:uncharacterized protein LOC132316293 n=1 Tax=Cornus florida TaxID=4283 RepID=UPI0028A14250|nr:uncharacterized protein LOC132316293 [Cornus florida]